MKVKTPSQGGGNIRIIPNADGNESSIGYYARTDLRSTTAGDSWVVGANCWNEDGYCIGTPQLSSCLNIILSGDVYLAYKLFVQDINILDTLNLKANASNVYTIATMDNKFTVSNGLISNKLNSATGLNSSLYIRTYEGAAIVTINDNKTVSLSDNLNVDGIIKTSKLSAKTKNGSVIIGNRINQNIVEFNDNNTT